MSSTLGAAAQIAARMQGDDYQARWFFLQAMRMFDPKSNVVSVGLEQKMFPWFDDVITHYSAKNRRNRTIDAHQVKFHVAANNAISFPGLRDPGFINSSSSLVQHILQMHRARAGDTDAILVTPWTIEPTDLLGSMVLSGTDGSLRLNLLFDGKKRSQAAQVRGELMEHCGVDETELRALLERFRIEPAISLNQLGARLDDKLARHGFVTVGENAQASIYDDLGRKLIAGDVRTFDREALRKLLRDEGLTNSADSQAPLRVGIRSFIRQAEYLDDYVYPLLDLLDAFDGRALSEKSSWREVGDRVRSFTSSIDDARHDTIEIYLSCHPSIAFAAGRAVSPKSGTRYLAHQPGRSGAAIWDLSARGASKNGDAWSFTVTHLRADAPDVALSIGVTHSIGQDVRQYLQRHVHSVGTLIEAQPKEGCGFGVIRDGAHAIRLAESLAQDLTAQLSPEQRRSKMHIFLSAPNALVFALGRASHRIPDAVIYEYEFEKGDPEGYSPAISFEKP
jgi:hypothetical protein